MRKDYQRFAELSNKGANVLGFKDTGAMWRGSYDMPADEFAKELDRLWDQLRPLYLSLHTYVRAKLHEKYGAAVPENGPPTSSGISGSRTGRTSPTSLRRPARSRRSTSPASSRRRSSTPSAWPASASASLPRSGSSRCRRPLRTLTFLKPQDREVVCHASAWDINSVDDVRIKMCIDVNQEDFITIHHELGHNFYQRVQQTAGHLPRQRERRIPRGARGHAGALGYSGVSGEDQPSRQGA